LIDLHRCCHLWKGIGNALKAGKQATGSVSVPVQGRWQEDVCKINQAGADVCQPLSTIALAIVRKPWGTIVPLSPLSYSNNLCKPHVTLNPHSSCRPFTDIHLKPCAANFSSAGSQFNADDTETRKNPGRPTPLKKPAVSYVPHLALQTPLLQ
jgi:hypothetical protein